MLLTLDVGNTETVLGLFDGQDLTYHWRTATNAEATAGDRLGRRMIVAWGNGRL